MCVAPEIASLWADRLQGRVREDWGAPPETRGYFRGATHCLASLFRAGRNEEILDLLALKTYGFWWYDSWGVKALAAMGKGDEAIRYAEAHLGLKDDRSEAARLCEEILLDQRLGEEAYHRYGFEANRTPCDPRTLTRAARDFVFKQPSFALHCGFTALKWLVGGYGYEITSADVWEAYRRTMEAAGNLGEVEQTGKAIRDLVARETNGECFVTRVLRTELGL